MEQPQPRTSSTSNHFDFPLACKRNARMPCLDAIIPRNVNLIKTDLSCVLLKVKEPRKNLKILPLAREVDMAQDDGNG